MVDVEKLKEQELEQLNKEEIVDLEKDEFSLEELIILGDDKKIPILIEYPLPDGRHVKTKALVKQLTMNELEHVKVTQDNVLVTGMYILQKALFKMDGERYTKTQLKSLPIGVVNAISATILELSGVDEKTRAEMSNFSI